ncbi:hypothetical protein FUA23_10935 [Neolewinella aurantiaca]|uniref:Uncharacterized protein n=1 Tax=Neolewinella aurantiaca TaxID=2602767 RepID=A0A5C7FWH8_9BACT|nr:hypothetical protein [Neolewinella aurantiaca]TXF89258.1 hypothetical protein FUA23_10935 [Neolewinella aurantiaca]
MSQLNELHQRPFSRSSTGRSTEPVAQYPRAPFPKVAALLIDPDTRTIRTVYLRATASGLKSIFGDRRVTFIEKYGFRAYGTSQYYNNITDRARLPMARLAVEGKTLITGLQFTEIKYDLAQQLIKETTFHRCTAHGLY